MSENCNDCGNTVPNCGTTIPSTCVILSKSFNYNCSDDTSCYKTLEDLLRYWKPIICKSASDIDMSGIDRSCYTADTNTNLTIKDVLQEVITNACELTQRVNDNYTAMLNYYPNYSFNLLDWKCIDIIDPCSTSGTFTLQYALQLLINKICSVSSSVNTLLASIANLPYQYPIDFTKYPCISHNTTKSDLENLFIKVNELCTNVGSNTEIATALSYDTVATSYNIAQTIQHLWVKLNSFTSGGGGVSPTYGNGIVYTGGVVQIDCTWMKNNCINDTYIRSKFTAGTNINYDPVTGVISVPNLITPDADTNASVLTGNTLRNRQTRVIYYESALALVSSTDLGATFTPFTSGAVTLTFPIIPVKSTGSGQTPIIVDKINAGVTKRLIPGIDYVYLAGRAGLDFGSFVALTTGDIIDVSYFS